MAEDGERSDRGGPDRPGMDRAILDFHRIDSKFDRIENNMQSMLRAIETHGRNLEDHARIHGETTKVLTRLTEKIDANDAITRQRDKEEAVAAERERRFQEDVSSIKADLKVIKDANVVQEVQKIRGGLDRVFWLVVTAVITSFVGLLFLAMRGGL